MTDAEEEISDDQYTEEADVSDEAEKQSEDDDEADVPGEGENDDPTASLPSLDSVQCWYNNVEDEQISKARTVYIYKNKAELVQAVNNADPIAGAIFKSSQGEPVLYAIFRLPQRSFGWVRIKFDDTSGSNFAGSWYAPLATEETSVSPPNSVKKIKALCKMAAVAIPLKYCVKANNAHRHKYCVITNWWKERNNQGGYLFPNLDFSLYP